MCGIYTLNFQWLNNNENEIVFRDKLIEEIEARTDLNLADDCAGHFPQFTWREWESSLNSLLETLKWILNKPS